MTDAERLALLELQIAELSMQLARRFERDNQTFVSLLTAVQMLLAEGNDGDNWADAVDAKPETIH